MFTLSNFEHLHNAWCDYHGVDTVQDIEANEENLRSCERQADQYEKWGDGEYAAIIRHDVKHVRRLLKHAKPQRSYT
jgi:hypothetical protein